MGGGSLRIWQVKSKQLCFGMKMGAVSKSVHMEHNHKAGMEKFASLFQCVVEPSPMGQVCNLSD